MNNDIPEYNFQQEYGFEFNPESFELLDNPDTTTETRYIKPRLAKRRPVRANYADELIDRITLEPGDCNYALVSGQFVFGDFVTRLIERKNAHVLKMHIATLSMSEENIMNLASLIQGDYIDRLDLLISAYFYAHERNNMIPMIYQHLDHDNKFQLAVVSIHAKIVLLQTEGGKYITIHGSANLRSCDNVEQVSIDVDKDLYDFNAVFLDSVTERYKTIKKPVRGKKEF